MSKLNLSTLKKADLYLCGALNRLTYNLHPVSHVFGDLSNAVEKLLASVFTKNEREEILALMPVQCRLRQDAIRRVTSALDSIRELTAAAESQALVDELICEEATTPEAKRFVAEFGIDSLAYWQEKREALAHSMAGKFFWAICDECEGHGKVGNPAFSNGITSTEWAEDWDEESRAAYMGGEYDVRCDCCKGSGKIKRPDARQMTFAEKREAVRQRQHRRIMAELAREAAAERAMGA